MTTRLSALQFKALGKLSVGPCSTLHNSVARSLILRGLAQPAGTSCEITDQGRVAYYEALSRRHGRVSP